MATAMLRNRVTATKQLPLASKYGTHVPRQSSVPALTTSYADVNSAVINISPREMVYSPPSALSPAGAPAPITWPSDGGPSVLEDEWLTNIEQVQDWANHEFEVGPAKRPVRNNDPGDNVVSFQSTAAYSLPLQLPDRPPMFHIYRTDLCRPLPNRQTPANTIDDLVPNVWVEHGLVDSSDNPDAFQKLNFGGELLDALTHAQGDGENATTWVNCLKDEKKPWPSQFPGRTLNPSQFYNVRLPFIVDMPLDELTRQIGGGNLSIQLPYASIKACFASSRVVPMALWISKENSNIPFDFNVQLQTTCVRPTGTQTRRNWMFADSVNPSSTPNTTPEPLLRLSHLVREGTNTEKRGEPELKFLHSSQILSPEFARWALTDFDALKTQVDGEAYKQNGKGQYRFVRHIRENQRHATDEVQFLCFSEWHRIVSQTDLRANSGVSKCSIDAGKAGNDEYTIKVDAGLLHQFIDEKRDLVNANNNIMQVYDDRQQKSHLWLNIAPIHLPSMAVNALKLYQSPTEPIRAKIQMRYQCTLLLRYLALPD